MSCISAQTESLGQAPGALRASFELRPTLEKSPVKAKRYRHCRSPPRVAIAHLDNNNRFAVPGRNAGARAQLGSRLPRRPARGMTYSILSCSSDVPSGHQQKANHKSPVTKFITVSYEYSTDPSSASSKKIKNTKKPCCGCQTTPINNTI